MNEFYKRAGLFGLMYIVVVIVPWWLSAVLLFGLTVYFSNYVEVLFFGFLFDVLYASQFPMPFLGLLIATVFLMAVILIKTQIRT